MANESVEGENCDFLPTIIDFVMGIFFPSKMQFDWDCVIGELFDFSDYSIENLLKNEVKYL
jgi:hypothetical protein